MTVLETKRAGPVRHARAGSISIQDVMRSDGPAAIPMRVASERIALTTSPFAFVPRDHQIPQLTVLLAKRTLPSPIMTLTPPGWWLWALTNWELSGLHPAS